VSGQPVQELARLLEVAGFETLAEGLIDGGERGQGLARAALLGEEAPQAGRRAQLEGAAPSWAMPSAFRKEVSAAPASPAARRSSPRLRLAIIGLHDGIIYGSSIAIERNRCLI
jgi:hypothetical protein